MHYLYVCHFSNGHIKVGRSIQPKTRIAAHADRVACLGVELIEYHLAECISHAAPAEDALIQRCTESASKRNRSEWFEGLDYIDVCQWADDLAKIEYVAESKYTVPTAIHTAITLAGGVKQLAQNIGVPHQSVYFWASGERRVPAEHCLSIEYFTAGEVRCEDLRPDVNWGVLRNQHEKEAA